MLATWLLSIPVYGLFPVAPPRLADIGMVDTISSQTGFAMDSSLTTSFYNELAAVPSLHVGFAFAIGIAVASATSNRWLKVAGHLWGPTVALAVVATGNHYVFDIAAGMVAAAIGYGLGALVAKGTRAGRLEPDGVDRTSRPSRRRRSGSSRAASSGARQLARRDRRRRWLPWLLCLVPLPALGAAALLGVMRVGGRRPARPRRPSSAALARRGLRRSCPRCSRAGSAAATARLDAVLWALADRSPSSWRSSSASGSPRSTSGRELARWRGASRRVVGPAS